MVDRSHTSGYGVPNEPHLKRLQAMSLRRLSVYKISDISNLMLATAIAFGCLQHPNL